MVDDKKAISQNEPKEKPEEKKQITVQHPPPALENSKGDEKKTFMIRVKRKTSENPVETIVLETIFLPGNRKRLRLLETGDYIQSCMNGLTLTENTSKGKEENIVPQHLVFQRVKFDHPMAKNIKVLEVDSVDKEGTLFKLPKKEPDLIQEKRANIMKHSGFEDATQRKEKIMEKRAKDRKEKMRLNINAKRNQGLEQIRKGTQNQKNK